MRPIALFLLILLAPVALAHPLDDKAQMTSEVVIVSDRRLEYELDFRYLNAAASASEIDNGLDANKDGTVTLAELKRRWNALVDELSLAITISVDGEPLRLDPNFDRFEFMEDTWGSTQITAPEWDAYSLNIHYKFVYTWDAPKPLGPGEHTVEYWFNGLQSVVHTPADQMVAIDARTEPRVRLTDVKHTSMGIPKLTFSWQVDAPIEPIAPTPASESTLPFTAWQPEADQSRTFAWLFFVLAGAGGASATVLVVLLNRRRKTKHPG